MTTTLGIDPIAAPVHVRMLVPLSDGRQAILDRKVRPSAFRVSEENAGTNLWARWDASGVKPQKGDIAYDVTARTSDDWFEVPTTTLVGIRSR